jgi:hypothetical protein
LKSSATKIDFHEEKERERANTTHRQCINIKSQNKNKIYKNTKNINSLENG